MGTLLPGSKYFEDLHVGDRWVSPARTITEADFVTFACFVGDFNPLHVDEEWAKKMTPYGGRIAAGTMTVSIGLGLVTRIGLTEGTSLGLQSMDKIKFNLKNPLRIGDTIHVEVQVIGKKDLDKDRGEVTWRHTVKNQKDQTVCEFERININRKKPL